jgi:hypothetical protein
VLGAQGLAGSNGEVKSDNASGRLDGSGEVGGDGGSDGDGEDGGEDGGEGGGEGNGTVDGGGGRQSLVQLGIAGMPLGDALGGPPCGAPSPGLKRR